MNNKPKLNPKKLKPKNPDNNKVTEEETTTTTTNPETITEETIKVEKDKVDSFNKKMTSLLYESNKQYLRIIIIIKNNNFNSKFLQH